MAVAKIQNQIKVKTRTPFGKSGAISMVPNHSIAVEGAVGLYFYSDFLLFAVVVAFFLRFALLTKGVLDILLKRNCVGSKHTYIFHYRLKRQSIHYFSSR